MAVIPWEILYWRCHTHNCGAHLQNSDPLRWWFCHQSFWRCWWWSRHRWVWWWRGRWCGCWPQLWPAHRLPSRPPPRWRRHRSLSPCRCQTVGRPAHTQYKEESLTWKLSLGILTPSQSPHAPFPGPVPLRMTQGLCFKMHCCFHFQSRVPLQQWQPNWLLPSTNKNQAQKINIKSRKQCKRKSLTSVCQSLLPIWEG